MGPSAVERRLREVGVLSGGGRRSVDMSASAVTRRLEEVEQLRRLCQQMGGYRVTISPASTSVTGSGE